MFFGLAGLLFSQTTFGIIILKSSITIIVVRTGMRLNTCYIWVTSTIWNCSLDITTWNYHSSNYTQTLVGNILLNITEQVPISLNIITITWWSSNVITVMEQYYISRPAIRYRSLLMSLTVIVTNNHCSNLHLLWHSLMLLLLTDFWSIFIVLLLIVLLFIVLLIIVLMYGLFMRTAPCSDYFVAMVADHQQLHKTFRLSYTA